MRTNQRKSKIGRVERMGTTTTTAHAPSVEVSCPPAHLENKSRGSESASSSCSQESRCREGLGASMNRKQPAFRIHLNAPSQRDVPKVEFPTCHLPTQSDEIMA